MNEKMLVYVKNVRADYKARRLTVTLELFLTPENIKLVEPLVRNARVDHSMNAVFTETQPSLGID